MTLLLVPLATLRITIARQTRLDGLPVGGRLVGEVTSGAGLLGERAPDAGRSRPAGVVGAAGRPGAGFVARPQPSGLRGSVRGVPEARP